MYEKDHLYSNTLRMFTNGSVFICALHSMILNNIAICQFERKDFNNVLSMLQDFSITNS